MSKIDYIEFQNRTWPLAYLITSEHRAYVLHAINVRTNHVHLVVSASCKPEHVMDSFKAYATRKLREEDLLS